MSTTPSNNRRAVLYTDVAGTVHHALTTAFDPETNTADLLLINRDPAKAALIQSGDYTHGLERLFTVESQAARYARLKTARQVVADKSGADQAAITAADLGDTFTFFGDADVDLASEAPFVSTKKAAAPVAEAPDPTPQAPPVAVTETILADSGASNQTTEPTTEGVDTGTKAAETAGA